MIGRMMAYALIAAALTSPGIAQVDKDSLMTANPQSPPKETSLDVGGRQIWIVYHAPSVRGRKIFGASGALVPNGSIWRVGADETPILHTDAALQIGGVTIPAGDYSLYVDIAKDGNWRLEINKQTDQWGVDEQGNTTLDKNRNVAEAPMTMTKPEKPVEVFRVSLTPKSGKSGELRMEWENVSASVDFILK
jgi:hypothetical protein